MASDEDQEKKAEERTSPTGEEVYRAIKSEGESELERSSSALWWSGLAAGLGMGFSFITATLLHSHLPQAKWTPLVTALGYTIGFVIVILGRQQLFTENTLTVVLPLLTEKKLATLGNMLRLWAVVLAANFAGAVLIALVLAKTEAVDAETFESLRKVAEESHRHGFAITLLRGIFAGWLIALVVWLLPFAETARVLVIMILTWIIAVSHFSHVIAGSVDGMFLVFIGTKTFGGFLTQFFVPSLIGNIVGGVSLVASLNHAQVVAGGGGTDV